MKGLRIIPARGAESFRPLDRAPTREDLCRVIGCDTPEVVNVLHGGRRAQMVVDEDGHAKRLAYNATATAIYYAATRAGLTGLPKDAAEDHHIVGTAVLLEGVVYA